MTSERDRIEGSLLGLAWGDVFGCPVEGWRAGQIQTVYGVYDRLPEQYPLEKIRPLGEKAVKRLRPLGLHSDDTQQALALVQVCLTGWSPESWAALLVEGMKRGAWRGYGRNFTSAIHKLKRGVLPQQAGSPSAGIGAVMRIGPLGALYRDDPATLARVVMESSFVTHGDIRSGAMALAVAHSVAALLAGRTAAEVMRELPGVVEQAEREWLQGRPEWTIDRSAGHQVSRCLKEFLAEPLADMQQLRERVSATARPHLPPEFTVAHPNQGFVLLGGLHSLAVALSPSEEPAALLAEIVAQGYDTDTVAAIAGSLLGARFGTAWLPRERLLDRQRLEQYAAALVERRAAPEDGETLLAREAELSRR
jgi:ADP-ribosylglycohydrolase